MKKSTHRTTSEKKLRRILENIRDGILVTDPDWLIVYINQAAEKMLNRPREALLEKNIWSEFPEAINKTFHHAYQVAMEKQESMVIEDYSQVLKKWIQVVIFPSPDGLSIHFHDTTKERLSELEVKASKVKYSELLDRITDGFIALDKNFYYTYANKKIGELVQRNPASLIGKNVWEEFPDAIGSYTHKAFQTAMTEQRFISNIDYYKPLDLWQENHIYPSPEGLTVFIKDITERKKLEKELLESERAQQQQLTYRVIEAQEQERSKLGQELHDNINQLVTASKLKLSLLRKQPELLPEILPACINHLEMVIEENRKLSHSLITPDLENGSLIQQLIFLTESMFQSGITEVKMQAHTFDEALLSKAQKLAIYRITQEQCTNIVKYAGASLVTCRLEAENGLFIMTIADNGRGSDFNTSEKGIGIRNIKNRLELFGGTLVIHTKPEQGFSLTCQFPLSRR